MKKLALVFLMLQTAFLLAAPDKPNPSDFTVTVHVVSSASLITGNVYFQVLETVINGQPVELQESSLGVLALSHGVLALGDYPARISLSIHGPKNPNSYDIYKGYDFLMPDGTVRTYAVTRLGPALSHP